MTHAPAVEPQPPEALPIEKPTPPWELVAVWLASRTPEEIEEARRELRAASRPARPLPEGKTLSDMVCGKWPGDETDEEVAEALERLS